MKSLGSLDSVAQYIQTNFKSETEKIRAVFYWTASNIKYDVENMFNRNPNISPKDRLLKTLETKKGVCSDYAAVFNEVANLLGFKSFVIGGYTKQNEKIDVLSHAWCGTKIENKWCLFDPTWGSGVVTNGKYISKINNSYFKVEPSKIISSHIPFDYLWQFVNYPISNYEFHKSQTQTTNKKQFFDYEKELNRQNTLTEIDREFESAERIKKNGLINTLIQEYYEYKKQHIKFLRNKENVEKLNTVVELFNKTVFMMNDFIAYRNKKFKPNLTDDEIIALIRIPLENFIKCKNDIETLGPVGENNESNLINLKKSIESNLKIAKEHDLFVKNYMSKSNLIRKTMFLKVVRFQ